jgi:hypothetical protein
MILHSTEIEKATVQVNCGNESSGTAFFIFVDNEKQILLTSEHNLKGESIKLYVGDIELNAEVLERIPEYDVAILKTRLETTSNIAALPLKNTQIPYNADWETYGFPAERVNSGGRYNGTVSRINTEGTKWDVDLECNQYSNLEKFDGLSGSALIIDCFVVGVIGYDNVGTLGATSIQRISEVLEKHGIVMAIDNNHSIPDSIEEDILNNTPNIEVLNRINEVISDQITSSYFLVSGNPGSGKTTIIAQLELKSEKYVIIDRFFIKVPENEELPTQIRATPEFFIRWIEEVCYHALYNKSFPKPKPEMTLNDRILAVHQIIELLSNYFQKQEKTAFLIIDGLDDVSKSKIEDYLFVLPQHLPSNFKVIFSCTSKEVLPASIRGTINTSNEIKTTPLPIQQAKRFLYEQLKDKPFSLVQINELAQKSEGHPLYLRYLVKYVLEKEDIISIDNWIDSIPVIGGEIENYYNKIWQQIDELTDEIWLVATLARLRIPIEKGTLSALVPESTKYYFLTSFKKIQHLLRGTDLISIYHTSFSDFINEKTREIDNQVHANIARFILKNRQKKFGISERIYHLAHGDETDKRAAIEECNQTWVDDCAMNSINPDIVLTDIKDIIGLAAEIGIAHKVISLLLLSQRVNFRYNTLFHENAIFLVRALLALNKPEEAIRYVVRNKALITADEDALNLLQLFYEYEANEEAEILLNAINQTCNNIVESGFNTDLFNRYIWLKCSAVTLSSNSDFEDAFHEYMHLKNKIIKIIEVSGNSKETIHTFKDVIGSYNNGYLIWRFGFPPFSRELEDKFQFDDKSSGFIAMSIHEALNFQEKSPVKKEIDNISDWIEDLEYVIDKYGTHPDYYLMILPLLLDKSKRIDIIEELYKKIYLNFNEENFDFREANGVDLNLKTLHKFMLYSECQGFLDVTNQFPILPKYGFFFDSWEGDIKMILHCLCFLSGKVKRYQIEERNSETKLFEPKLNDLFEKLIPDLKNRMYWERAYALPELIYPDIYRSLINLLIETFPNQIIILVESIVQKTYYQLGLYTEGYIESLFIIARNLAKKPEHESSAFKVIKVLEEYIIATVENRWERNEYLLIELYALLKNEYKAKNIFKEMIDTSMGPSWYKEAQLGIINTVVSNIIPINGDQSYFQKFAAHLHNASGEMTFQRYIKQQQEQFVGDLAKIGFLDKSIAYFKYLLFPDYKTIIHNAESSKTDMPSVGNGYILGARDIEEQSGILHILQNIDSQGSLISWGLSEIFILGDSKWHLLDYAKIQAKIFNYVEINEPIKLDILLKRLSRFVIAEISNEYRYEYLSELFNKLSFSNFEKVKSYLESTSIISLPTRQYNIEEDEIISLQHNERKDPLDILVTAKKEVQKKLNVENKSEARKIIIEALQKVQNQKYGIWSSNHSNKINEIRNLFSESYNTSSELIKDIKDLIINEPYFEEWVIANQIINLLQNVDDEHEKQLIQSSVLEHIDLMIRTPQTFYDRYSWLSNSTDKITSDKQDNLLLELLIWFLNHPRLVVKNRTIEILCWLGTITPNIIIRALVKEIISEGYKVSKELSSSIIHQISNLNPTEFSQILKTVLEQNEDKILGLKHFMIKNSLLDSLKELKIHGSTGLDDLIMKFEQTFNALTKSNGDILVEEDYLESISDYLYELNELGILTREFAEILLSQINKLIPISSISECQKANTYINRSFNNDNNIEVISDIDTLLRYALNIAISSCVTLENRENVANILRFYQPTFPENKLQVQMRPIEEQFKFGIKKIFEEDNIDIEKLLLGGEFPLNFLSIENNDSNRPSEKIELTTYLIPLNRYRNQYFYPSTFFFENTYPMYYQEDEDIIPLFIKSQYIGGIAGSELVPAVLNPNVIKLVPEIANSISSIYWRIGRNWDNNSQGVAQQTGYYTTVPKNIIAGLKSKYKLIWQIYSKFKYKYIDVFEQKEIKNDYTK